MVIDQKGTKFKNNTLDEITSKVISSDPAKQFQEVKFLKKVRNEGSLSLANNVEPNFLSLNDLL